MDAEGACGSVRRLGGAAASRCSPTSATDPKHDIRLTIAGRGPTILGLARAPRLPLEHVRGVRRPRRRGPRDGEEGQREARRALRRDGPHGRPLDPARLPRLRPETPWRSDEAFADVIGRWREAGFDEAVFYYPPDTNMPEGTVTRASSSARFREGLAAGGRRSRAPWRARSVPTRCARRLRRGSRSARAKAARGHQHPELIGLGLAAFGLFMAQRALRGLERRLRRQGDRRRPGRGRRRDRLRAAGRVRRDRRADGRAQRPAALRAVPHRARRRRLRRSRSCSAARTAATSGEGLERSSAA